MDATVKLLGDQLLSALRNARYAKLTVGQYEKMIRTLAVFVDARGGIYTKELGVVFSSLTTSPRTGKFSAQRRFSHTRITFLFDQLIDTGEVCFGHRTRGGGGRHPDGEAFQQLDAKREAEMLNRELALATRNAYGRITRCYLTYLEDHNITSLESADQATITGFLESLIGRWAKSSLFWVVSNFRPFLKFCGRADLIEALSFAGIRRPHPILPVVTDGDVQRVVAVCSQSEHVAARDAAITLLALLTGLRACDIIALRLRSIDWRAGVICLVQQKTKGPLTLPLPDLLRAKLVDYVLNERPVSSDDHLFLRRLAPFTPLADHASIHRIITTVFSVASVSRPQAGTRLLRHTAATRMLRAATPLPTISAVLGHASSESTSIYLSVDTDRLRECVLPIPAGARS